MEKTIFAIPKMDCPSEESLIRVKLDGIPAIKNLDFDIPNRQLTVFHEGELAFIKGRWFISTTLHRLPICMNTVRLFANVGNR